MPGLLSSAFSFRKKGAQAPPASELLTGAAAFHIFDADGSGFLDAEELKVILQRPGGGSALSDEDVAAIIAEFDANGDGVLQFEEFEVMWAEYGGTSKPAAASADGQGGGGGKAGASGGGGGGGGGNRRKSVSSLDSSDERSGLQTAEALKAAAAAELAAAESNEQRAAKVTDEKFERRLGNALLQNEREAQVGSKGADGGKAQQKWMAELMRQWDKNGAEASACAPQRRPPPCPPAPRHLQCCALDALCTRHPQARHPTPPY